MGEFELIRRYFVPLAQGAGSEGLLLGPGDDCALQRLSPGTDLVFSTDTLVEGVHFPSGYNPRQLGWRSLAVAASDLAAMGARPVCFTLALTLPVAAPEWVAGYAHGLGEAAQAFGLVLAGGDTTRGPLTLTLQVHGEVPAGEALRRSGARPGDQVCVSGTLGAAAAALRWLAVAGPPADAAEVLARYHRPMPRLALGQALRGLASAAIDVSDGLLADLTHILDASGVGARIDAAVVPVLPAVARLEGERAQSLALSGGDDYELCVTISPARWQQLPAAVQAHLTVIGEITAETGLQLVNADAHARTAGYDHFGEHG
ncbi:thiamine-phosphate kinase [Marinobacter sp. X15-166B]|uniref:thiamine-phosphate kinase n=1 Tax=Marinobacter sp. X15-166B TaxID=1897620 RepID=UPI00085BF2D4|nr:thiamine-phosphate kinase [Marinobacter sp. X15-166B]OEY66638.1 thiamine-phosphate kinase [Marinobacter sp. X15-166B]